MTRYPPNVKDKRQQGVWKQKEYGTKVELRFRVERWDKKEQHKLTYADSRTLISITITVENSKNQAKSHLVKKTQGIPKA